MPQEAMLSTQGMELVRGPFVGDLLTSPYEVDFGTEVSDEGKISVKNLEIRLGDRPVCRNLRRLYELAHRELPPDIAVFHEYDIWSLSHVIGAIHRKDSYPKIKGLGYEAIFEDEEEVFTIEILPRSKFLKVAGVETETQFDLGLEGHAQIPESVKMLLEQVEYLGGDAKIKLASDVKMVGRVSFSVMTPIIQAIGQGSSHCEWLFEVDDKPLLGDQIMLQTILVPRNTASLKFKARGYALIKSSFVNFPAMFYTNWLNIECPLI